EADARRLGVIPVKTSDKSAWALARVHGYHFISLGAIAVFLATGMSAFMAVFWSIAIGFALSLLRAETRLALLPGAAIGFAVVCVLQLSGERVAKVISLLLSGEFVT